MGILLVVAGAAGAQQPSEKPPRELCGSFNRPGISSVAGVVREADGAPIPFATIQFEGGYTTETVAERSGCFSIKSPRNAAMTLDVRRIGFQPYSQQLDLRGDSTVFIDVRLVSVAKPVEGVTVTAPRNDAMEATGFYDRMLERNKGLGNGYFITPEDIQARHADNITSLIGVFPNVDVHYSTQNGHASEGYIFGRSYAAPPGANDRCAMNLFVDGARHPSGISLDALDLNTTVNAIEVYPTPMQTPPQYQTLSGDGACGAVVVWTQRPDFTRNRGNWFKENLLTLIVVPVVLGAALLSLGHAP